MAAGDFSASALLDINLKAEERWRDSRATREYTPNAEAARAVLANQTATFQELTGKDKDRKAKITWLNPCGVQVRDCESDCDISGPELESMSEEYELTLCKETAFSIDRETTRTNAYSREEQASRGMATAIKVLDEWWAGQNIIRASAFAGINVYPTPWTYDAGDNTTEIPAAQYNLDMIPDIIHQAQMNNMPDAYFINNGDLVVAYLRAKMAADNLDGKYDAAAIKALNMYFDSYNFAKVGASENIFAIAPSAMAMVTKTRNPDTPEYIGGTVNQDRYTVNSSLPGVKYDVFHSIKCITGNDGKERIVDAWKVKTLGDIFLNPSGCPVTIGGNTYTPTGVYSYTKVA